jgi:hypothetical protein
MARQSTMPKAVSSLQSVQRLYIPDNKAACASGGNIKSQQNHPAFYPTSKSKVILCLIKHYTMKTSKGMAVYLRAFLTAAVDEVAWTASRPGKIPRYPLDGCF